MKLIDELLRNKLYELGYTIDYTGTMYLSRKDIQKVLELLYQINNKSYPNSQWTDAPNIILDYRKSDKAEASLDVDTSTDPVTWRFHITVPTSGMSAYDVAVSNGFIGDVNQWLESLRGPKGNTGDTGPQGNSGYQGAAGELEVVNNLTEGGSTSALSAEMGKKLSSDIEEMGEYTKDYIQNIISVSPSRQMLDYLYWMKAPIRDGKNTGFGLDSNGYIINLESGCALAIVKAHKGWYKYKLPNNVKGYSIYIAGVSSLATIISEDKLILGSKVDEVYVRNTPGDYSFYVADDSYLVVSCTFYNALDWAGYVLSEVDFNPEVTPEDLQALKTYVDTFNVIINNKADRIDLVDVVAKISDKANQSDLNSLRIAISNSYSELSKLQESLSQKVDLKTVTDLINNINVTEVTGDVTNNVDGVDITSVNGVLRLSNRETLNGYNYVIVRQLEDINKINTIYEIRDTIDLGDVEFNIPSNSIFYFNGGNIINGTLIGNSTIIINDNINCKSNGTFLDSNRKDYVPRFNKTFPFASYINTQEEFDTIIQKVNEENSDNILYLSDNTFIAKSKIIPRGNLAIYNGTIKPNNKVYRKCDAISSTSTHYVCKLQESIEKFSVFVDSNNNLINVSEVTNPITLVNTIDSLMSFQHEETNLVDIKIPIATELMPYLSEIESNMDNVYGTVACWWEDVKFKVTGIDRDDNTFLCTMYKEPAPMNIAANKTDGLNSEYTVYKSRIDYILHNVTKVPNSVYYDDSNIYIPIDIDSIEVINYKDKGAIIQVTEGKDIVLDNVKIYNSYNGVNIVSGKDNICNVNKCNITNTLGVSFYIKKFNNGNIATITNCEFKQGSLSDSSNIVDINSEYNNNRCIEVKKCLATSANNNLLYYRSRCRGFRIYADALVEDCVVFNTSGYFGNGGGDNIVRHCISYNTDEYNRYQHRNFARDSGGFYVGNQSAINTLEKCRNNTLYHAQIEFCLIKNIRGKGDVRGIFIDDGRGFVTCKYNLILDSQYYSIDSRETSLDCSSFKNFFYGNIMNVRYRLRYGSGLVGEEIPQASNNILLYNEDSDTELDYPDIRVNNYKILGDIIILPTSVYEQLDDNQKIFCNSNSYNAKDVTNGN